MKTKFHGRGAAHKGLKLFCTMLVACAFAISGAGKTPAADSSGNTATPAAKPNIVFFLTDDLAMNLVQYMPSVVQMQKEGVTFSNYFVTDSLCCPSRSSIFTGNFPHNTGVFTNKGPLGGYKAFNSHGNEQLTFAVALQRDGYKTAMLGKYLNGYLPMKDGIPAGWNEWDVAGAAYREFNYELNQNGHLVKHGFRPEDYLTDVLAGIADSFVRKSASGPFMIEIATFAPHAPYTPAPRDAGRFSGLPAPRSIAFGARPDSNAPQWLKSVPALGPSDIQEIDQNFRKRVQAVQAIDKMIGQIRSTLSTLGLQNTYIVFSSDNGLHMGEYSLRPGKMTPFETDIHVPLIIVGPGVPKGVSIPELTENIDLNPTFLELAGATSTAKPDGHSLVPFLSGNSIADWRHMTLIEHRHPEKKFPDEEDPDTQKPHAANPTSYEALRLENALYVEYESGEIGYYDLDHDPNELKNVAPALPVAKVRRLHEMLSANKTCRGGDPCWAAQRMTP